MIPDKILVLSIAILATCILNQFHHFDRKVFYPQGCTVIGYAGTDAKCDWLKSLGFDYAFNYKTTDLRETLKEAAPKGIDVYYDNV